MTATYILRHEPGADVEAAEGPCIPRISFDCSACTRSVVFCHVSRTAVRDYVDPNRPRWRCRDCRGNGGADVAP